MQTIACVFRNTLPLGGTAESIVEAVADYVSGFVAPEWCPGSQVVQRDLPQQGERPVYILDNADQAGQLGRHEVGRGPVGYVFLEPTREEGKEITIPLGHEIAELLADPWCNLCVRDPQGRFVALEIVDPVQETTFTRRGWPVPNFVLPAWFGQGDGPVDQLQTLQVPWQLSDGGYVSVYQDGGWGNLFGSDRAEIAHACGDNRLRRWARRRRLVTAARCCQG